MRRRLAARAKIFRRADEPASEEMLPNVVDRDARGERIFRISNPARQIKPVRDLASRMERVQCGEDSRPDFISLPQKIAADMHERLHLICEQPKRGCERL